MSSEPAVTIATTTDADTAAFAAAVRAHLADLDPDDREQLVADRESDVAEQVADVGPQVLRDPERFADELRAAAGLGPAPAVVASVGASRVADRLQRGLDDLHARWQSSVAGLPGRPWELVLLLRPTWWLLRAWVALSAIDLVFGSGSIGLGLSLVPTLLGWGGPLLAVAVLGSVMMGAGRVWPGRGGAGARVTLLLLNLLALGLAPVTVMSVTTAADVVLWYGLR